MGTNKSRIQTGDKIMKKKVFAFLGAFMMVSVNCFAGPSSFIHARIGAEEAKLVHVQLVGYFGETLGLERDVTAYFEHEIVTEGNEEIFVIH